MKISSRFRLHKKRFKLSGPHVFKLSKLLGVICLNVALGDSRQAVQANIIRAKSSHGAVRSSHVKPSRAKVKSSNLRYRSLVISKKKGKKLLKCMYTTYWDLLLTTPTLCKCECEFLLGQGALCLKVCLQCNTVRRKAVRPCRTYAYTSRLIAETFKQYSRE